MSRMPYITMLVLLIRAKNACFYVQIKRISPCRTRSLTIRNSTFCNMKNRLLHYIKLPLNVHFTVYQRIKLNIKQLRLHTFFALFLAEARFTNKYRLFKT